MTKPIFSLLVVLTLMLSGPTIISAQAELGQDYIVQADDWLSKLADKFYSDPLAYSLIIEGTNRMAEQDSRYAPIINPDRLEVGQLLFIPNDEAALAQLTPAAEPSPDVVEQEAEVAMPPTAAQLERLAGLASRGVPPELYNEVWLNSEPLKLADLHGKVVIVEFWTYG